MTVDEAVEQLMPLVGVWRGEGVGDYPTIEAFRYAELLRFEFDAAYPMFHFEQRAFLLPTTEASHWECGFLRPLEGGIVEISSAQDSGRVEVLRGQLSSSPANGGLELDLSSVVLDHDPRLVCSGRIWKVAGDRFESTTYMSTNTTPEPQYQQHLKAVLERAPLPGKKRKA